MFKFILSCVLFYLPEIISMERSLIITTTSGAVKGKLNDFDGIQYYSYQGIPYAENPTGKLRFKPPVPRKPWTYILDATQEGAICSQLPKFFRLEETTEDCLNINIYVPREGTDMLLPVMVFVHGGALQYLSGHTEYIYAPQFLLSRKIIFVSMNYRLGPFGFLSLDIDEASGNAGLKDVILSLKWVKENIEKFGGDPDRITIAGHSSGSLIINYLMLMDQSEGLFNQAILLSGSAFSPRSFAKHCKDVSLALAKELGIETDDVYKTLECLQNIDALEILRAYSNLSKTHHSPFRIYAPFVPTKEVNSDHAVYTLNPIEAFKKNNLIAHKVPVLVGITSQEALSIILHVLDNIDGVEKIQTMPECLIPSNIEYPIGSQRSKNLSKVLSDTYFGKNMQNLTLTTFIEYISDTYYVYGVYYWIEKYKKMADSDPLYLYIFDFIGDLNGNQLLFNSIANGTRHGGDIPYIFVSNFTKNTYNSADEKSKRMKDTMVKFISNFVYYGNPTPGNVNNSLQWLDYGKEQNYLLINENPVMQTFNSSPIYSRMKLWEQIYKEYYDYVENGGKIENKIIP